MLNRVLPTMASLCPLLSWRESLSHVVTHSPQSWSGYLLITVHLQAQIFNANTLAMLHVYTVGEQRVHHGLNLNTLNIWKLSGFDFMESKTPYSAEQYLPAKNK